MSTNRQQCRFKANPWDRCLWLLLVLVVFDSGAAQLAIHTDANSNSFTLKAPGLQQSFTRYFNGRGGNLQQASLSNLQAQQLQPTQYSASAPAAGAVQQQYQQLAGVPQLPQAYAQQQIAYSPQSVYQQQYQQPSYATYQPAAPGTAQSYPQAQVRPVMRQAGGYTPPTATAAHPMQGYSDQMTSPYYTLQQQQQEQQRLQQQLLKQLYEQPQLGAPTAAVPQAQYQQSNYQPHQSQLQQGSGQGQQYFTAQQYAEYLQNQQHHIQSEQFNNMQQTYNNANQSNMAASSSNASTPLSGYANGLYSPADKVSRVRYSSGNLNYNF